MMKEPVLNNNGSIKFKPEVTLKNKGITKVEVSNALEHLLLFFEDNTVIGVPFDLYEDDHEIVIENTSSIDCLEHLANLEELERWDLITHKERIRYKKLLDVYRDQERKKDSIRYCTQVLEKYGYKVTKEEK